MIELCQPDSYLGLYIKSPESDEIRGGVIVTDKVCQIQIVRRVFPILLCRPEPSLQA